MPYPKDKDKKKRRNALKIAEISGVDVPAQEGARALIMKRHEPELPTQPIEKGSEEDVHDERARVAKAAALTTPAMDHTHLLFTSGPEGDWDAGVTSWHDEHAHPWVRTADGSIVLGEVNGHTHEIAAMTKAVETNPAGVAGTIVEKEADMPNDTKATPSVEDLQKQLDRANAVAALNDAEKAHFNALEADKQDAFLAKSAEDRKAELDAVEKAKTEADPVVYTTMDGVEMRKSAGDALIAMAKSNDTLRKQNEKMAKDAADAELRKRAEDELPHLPGDVEARVALLKSVEAIEDETQRAAALSALKAQNTAMKGAFTSQGHGGSPVQKSAEAQLDELAKKHAEDNGVSFAKAYDVVLSTDKGQELYAQTLN